jgi:hypothetical protein
MHFPSRPRAVRTVILCGVTAGILIAGAATPALADTGHEHLAAADIPTVVNNLRNWLVGILAVLATLFFTIGGIRYVASGGNPGEVEKAKTAFKSAAIGYGLAVLAPVFVTVLKSIVGG